MTAMQAVTFALSGLAIAMSLTSVYYARKTRKLRQRADELHREDARLLRTYIDAKTTRAEDLHHRAD